MTSVNSFFRMILKDIKRRIWCPVALMVAFFLSMEVNCLIRLQQLTHGMPTARSITEAAELGYLNNQFLTPDYGGMAVWIMGLAALFCGISGFSFLNSKKQIDLYHSIPISRGSLFAVKYISGIICFLVPFLLNLCLTMVMAVTRGIVNGQTFLNLLGYVSYQIIYFLSIYTVVVIAVLLTGNIVLNFIASLILLFYNFIFWGACTAISSTFLHTFAESFFEPFLVLTPIQAMMNGWEKMSVYRDTNLTFSYRPVISNMLLMIPVIAVLLIIALFLDKKRPSESAEKSIAFKVSEPIVKTMILLPGSVLCASLFLQISDYNNFGWFLFGGIFGFFMIGLVLEMIFRQDFKGAFCHWRYLVVNFAVMIVLVLCCKLDVAGYDSYLPAEKKLDNMGISIDNLDNSVDYYQNGQYMENARYRLEHMQMKDMSAVYALAATAVKNPIVVPKNNYNHQDEYQDAIPLTVAYRLRNGKQVYRQYYVDGTDDTVMALLNQIYASAEYKDGAFPVLTGFDDTFRQIDCTSAYEDGIVKLNQSNRQAFIDAYRKDLQNLTLDQIRTEYPLGSISFEVTMAEKNRNGLNYYNYSNTYMGYPIYPEFAETIAWFKEQGFDFMQTIPADAVTEVTVWDYTDTGADYMNTEYPHVVYDDPVEIQSILDNTASYFNMYNSYYMPLEDNIEVDVTYAGKDGVTTRYLYYKKGKVPDSIRQDLDVFTAEENKQGAVTAEPAGKF